MSLLEDPQVVQTSNGDNTDVTFDIKADLAIRPYIKFYYTTDGSDQIESDDNLILL